MALDLTRYETMEEIRVAERIYSKVKLIPWTLVMLWAAGIICVVIFGETADDKILGTFLISLLCAFVIVPAFVFLNDYVRERVSSIMHRRRVLDIAINQEIGEEDVD